MSIKQMNMVFDDNRLTPTRKLIMIVLADSANDTGVCFPSINTIKDKTNLSNGTVNANLKWLFENAIIFKKNRSRKKGGRSSNKYLIYPYENREFLDEQDFLIFEDLYTQSPTDGQAPQSPTDGQGSGTQSPTDGQESEPSLKNYNHHLPQTPQILKEWIAYRKQIKKPLSEISIKRLLDKYNSNPLEFKKSVEQSIENGYQGLFAVKQNYKQQDSEMDSVDKFYKDMQQPDTVDVEVL